jgi:hypothetical protein
VYDWGFDAIDAPDGVVFAVSGNDGVGLNGSNPGGILQSSHGLRRDLGGNGGDDLKAASDCAAEIIDEVRVGLAGGFIEPNQHGNAVVLSGKAGRRAADGSGKEQQQF